MFHTFLQGDNRLYFPLSSSHEIKQLGWLYVCAPMNDITLPMTYPGATLYRPPKFHLAVDVYSKVIWLKMEMYLK